MKGSDELPGSVSPEGRGQALWEALGSLAGFFGCLCIAAQIMSEWRSKEPSSLSFGYAIGFFAIFVFWACYGARFGRTALWATNGPAAVLQAVLIVAAFSK